MTEQTEVSSPAEPSPALSLPRQDRDDLPYRIERILHSSRSGGLYAAEDLRDGTRVVLKEAAPDNEPGIARLCREHAMLRRLVEIDAVPLVHEHLSVDGHAFLALRRFDGVLLSSVLAKRHPWCSLTPRPQDFAEHAQWALTVHRRLNEIVAAIHELGVVHGDLHPINVLLRGDGDIALIDFGSATDSYEHQQNAMTRHGFVAPSDRSGAGLDRYALACVALALFLPMASVARFDTGRARQLAHTIARYFPVPDGFLNSAVRTIEGTGDGSERAWPPFRRRACVSAHHQCWDQTRGALTAAIVASATPERDDRLFPGDFDELTVGGLGIAHGAAGVLYALAATDCGRYPSFEDWLAERALRHGVPPGLYDGLHGVSYVLHYLGHRQRALDVLERCRRTQQLALGVDLFSGLSGIGLNLTHWFTVTGDGTLLSDALRVADEIANREPCERSGLMYGGSGPALLFLRLYRVTGDPALLDRAATALRADLRRVPRHQPGLASGAAGIALILDEYLSCRTDDEFAAESLAIRSAAQTLPPPMGHTTFLFDGGAGILAYLSHARTRGTTTGEPAIAALIHRLSWHALPYQRYLASPADRPLQLSMDVACGGAGMLLALGAALHHEPVGLPLLEPVHK